MAQGYVVLCKISHSGFCSTVKEKIQLQNGQKSWADVYYRGYTSVKYNIEQIGFLHLMRTFSKILTSKNVAGRC